MQEIILIGGLLAFITAIIISIKAIYKKDLTLVGKLFGLVYIIIGGIIYEIRPDLIEIQFLHLGFIIYLAGDLFANSLYLLLRKQEDYIKRKELLKSLADLSEKYYSIVENTPIGFYVFDSTGRIEYVNSYLCNLLEYKKEDLIGKSVLDIIHPSYKNSAKENIEKRIFGGVKTISYVLKVIKKGGDAMFVKVTGTRTENGHATITGSLTEIKVEDLDAWKSQLLS